jgi:hypothetical protein
VISYSCEMSTTYLFQIMRCSLFTTFAAGVFCLANVSAGSLAVPSADKKVTITLELKDGWKTEPTKDDGMTIDIPRSGVHIQVWALSQATVEDAAKEVAELIKGQVTKFTVTASKEIRVAEAAARQLTGTGEEADDSDPSNAEVYLFTVEGKVFMVCAHGEGDGTVKNREILTALLASVKKS